MTANAQMVYNLCNAMGNGNSAADTIHAALSLCWITQEEAVHMASLLNIIL